jgi:hypothetical protein
MKRPLIDVLALYRAMSQDITRERPELTLDLVRDLERLSHLYKDHGMRFFTVTLPALGKHLDKCLSESTYTRSGLLGSRPVSKCEVVPRLFRGLLLRVFDKSGAMHGVPDKDSIRYLRQLYYAVKKYEGDLDDGTIYESYRQFYQDESELPIPSGNWEAGFWSTGSVGDSFRDPPLPITNGVSDDTYQQWRAERPELLDTLQRVADMVSSSLGEFIPSGWRVRHGPGAVSEPYRNSKYEFGSWTERLSRVFDRDEFRFPNLSFAGRPGEAGSRDLCPEPTCKLIAVPKDMRGPRLIASEPISHQFCQQAIRSFLKDRLQSSPVRFSISITDQELSRNAVLRASHDGSMISADLKSASDRLSCYVVERMFRRNTSLLRALAATRTSVLAQNPKKLDKKQPLLLRLRKYAPMGNSTVFPLQSIVYTIIGVTALISDVLHIEPTKIRRRHIERASTMVRIFGDDILIASEAWPTMDRLLRLLWFRVNDSKTHTHGKFRESCGMDAYDGVDVTPAYVLRSFDTERPTTVESVVATSNNFYMKGWLNTSAWLRWTIPEHLREEIAWVHPDSGTFGWWSAGSSCLPRKTRWNRDLHVTEYCILRVETRVRRLSPEGEHRLYQWFIDNPGPEHLFSPGEVGALVKRFTRAWVTAPQILEASV